MLCPLMCAAQSEWEAPTNHNNANEAKTEKKEVKKEAKNPNTAIDHKDIRIGNTSSQVLCQRSTAR